MTVLTKSIAALLSFIPILLCTHAAAQTEELNFRHTGISENAPKRFFKEIPETNTHAPQSAIRMQDTVSEPKRFFPGKLWRNWFISGAAGAHTFQNRFSGISRFNGTISPEWSVGIGKWILPGIALKIEFIRSKSQGYTQFLTEHYGTGPIQINDQNIPFRTMETSWCDISGNIILNFTRLFQGYEGYNSNRHMDQLMGALGLGAVHHLGFARGQGSDNEFAGHAELQYSRFFNKSKKFSLDFKLRGIVYESSLHHDNGPFEITSRKLDCSIGMNIGLTYYLGNNHSSAPGSVAPTVYRSDFRDKGLDMYNECADTMMTRGTVGVPRTLTFYVFFPNDNSDKIDAVIEPHEKFNDIDFSFEEVDFGLNAHSGIPVLLEYMYTEPCDCLVSFADIYAALKGNRGSISKYTNPQTVEMISDIFRNSIITVIEAHEGYPANENDSGNNKNQTLTDPSALTGNRARAVVKWLKGTDLFKDTKSIVYIDKSFAKSINNISETVDQNLSVYLNRCVKVRLQLIY